MASIKKEKVYLDRTGQPVEVGDKVIYPTATTCKNSRSSIAIGRVREFNRGYMYVGSSRWSRGMSPSCAIKISENEIPERILKALEA